MSPPKILIAGAGIGGLCCALALRRRGVSVAVLKQADGSMSGSGAHANMKVLVKLHIETQPQQKIHTQQGRI